MYYEKRGEINHKFNQQNLDNQRLSGPQFFELHSSSSATHSTRAHTVGAHTVGAHTSTKNGYIWIIVNSDFQYARTVISLRSDLFSTFYFTSFSSIIKTSTKNGDHFMMSFGASLYTRTVISLRSDLFSTFSVSPKGF